MIFGATVENNEINQKPLRFIFLILSCNIWLLIIQYQIFPISKKERRHPNPYHKTQLAIPTQKCEQCANNLELLGINKLQWGHQHWACFHSFYKLKNRYLRIACCAYVRKHTNPSIDFCNKCISGSSETRYVHFGKVTNISALQRKTYANFIAEEDLCQFHH